MLKHIVKGQHQDSVAAKTVTNFPEKALLLVVLMAKQIKYFLNRLAQIKVFYYPISAGPSGKTQSHPKVEHRNCSNGFCSNKKP
jgi:hypothetical protein